MATLSRPLDRVMKTVPLFLKSAGFKWSLGALLTGRDSQGICRSVSTERFWEPGWPGESRVLSRGSHHLKPYWGKCSLCFPCSDILARAPPRRAPPPQHTSACKDSSLLITAGQGQSQWLKARGPAPASACGGEKHSYL